MTARDETYKELLSAAREVETLMGSLQEDCLSLLENDDAAELGERFYQLRYKLSAAVTRVVAEEDATHKQRMRYLRDLRSNRTETP